MGLPFIGLLKALLLKVCNRAHIMSLYLSGHDFELANRALQVETRKVLAQEALE